MVGKTVAGLQPLLDTADTRLFRPLEVRLRHACCTLLWHLLAALRCHCRVCMGGMAGAKGAAPCMSGCFALFEE